MHLIPVFHMDEAQLIWGDHVAYFDYTDLQTGEAMSTHDTEVEIREEKLAAQRAAEEEAQRAAAAAAASRSSSSSSSSSSSGNNSDGCLDDGLFW